VGLGPLGLVERAGGIERDAFAFDVDSGGLFPASPHRLVGDLGVAGGHLVRVVVEQDAHDLLGDVTVETGSRQCSGRAE